VSWSGRRTCRTCRSPRRRAAGTPPRSPSGRRPRLDRGRGVGVDDLREATIGLASGCPWHRDAVLDLLPHHTPVTSSGPPPCCSVESASGEAKNTAGWRVIAMEPTGGCGTSAAAALDRPEPAGPRAGRAPGPVCDVAHGRVLEIGFAVGSTSHWYPGGPRLAAIEPSDLPWSLTRVGGGVRQRPSRSSGAGLDGQRLDLTDDSHEKKQRAGDLSACARAEHPSLALREAPAGVRDGWSGCTRSSTHRARESVRRWQRRMEPVQRTVFAGCHLTRDVPALLASAGWRSRPGGPDYLSGLGPPPRPWT
jgi:hypothetical protein